MTYNLTILFYISDSTTLEAVYIFSWDKNLRNCPKCGITLTKSYENYCSFCKAQLKPTIKSKKKEPEITILIKFLFNLKAKRCKYCNYFFIPQHNRQVHCKPEHRKWYRQERYLDRRAQERRNSRMSYVDPNGNFIQLKSKHHLELGSGGTRLSSNRIDDSSEEKKKIWTEFKMLGLR